MFGKYEKYHFDKQEISHEIFIRSTIKSLDFTFGTPVLVADIISYFCSTIIISISQI